MECWAMENSELIAKLDLMEQRQKNILGNQAIILKRLETERERKTRRRKTLKDDARLFIDFFLVVFGIGFILRLF